MDKEKVASIVSCPDYFFSSGHEKYRIANNALLGGGVRVRVWVREQRKIKRRSRHY